MSGVKEAYESTLEAIKELEIAKEGDSNDAEIAAGHDVASSFAALDELLKEGSELPAAWSGSDSTVATPNTEDGAVLLGDPPAEPCSTP